MSVTIYVSALVLCIVVLLIDVYWFTIKLKARKLRNKFYKFISIKKYSYSYKGIDVINVLPFSSRVLGINRFYKTKQPIVDTLEEAQEGFYKELTRYHNEELSWQVANKLMDEKRKTK